MEQHEVEKDRSMAMSQKAAANALALMSLGLAVCLAPRSEHILVTAFALGVPVSGIAFGRYLIEDANKLAKEAKGQIRRYELTIGRAKSLGMALAAVAGVGVLAPSNQMVPAFYPPLLVATLAAALFLFLARIEAPRRDNLTVMLLTLMAGKRRQKPELTWDQPRYWCQTRIIPALTAARIGHLTAF